MDRRTVETKVYIKEKDLKNLRENTKKLKKAEENLSRINKQLEEMKDKYLRLAADFDNYKRRVEKEKQDIFKYGIENLIMQLIPFDDIFESVLKQMKNKPSSEIVQKGLEMLKTEFSKILEAAGVKKINSLNNRFDANIHEASEVIETDDYQDGQIIEEERPGYLLNGKTIRPALVKVAKKKCDVTDNDSKNFSSCKD